MKMKARKSSKIILSGNTDLYGLYFTENAVPIIRCLPKNSKTFLQEFINLFTGLRMTFIPETILYLPE